MKTSLLIVLLLSSSIYAETAYRVVKPDGTIEFSDDSLSGGEPFELRKAPATTFAPPSPSATTQPRSKVGSKRGEKAKGSIAITSPQPDQTLWADGSGVTVTVDLSSALQSGEEVTISLDGKVVTRGSGSSFNLGQVFRGSHTLGASVVTNSGEVLFSASPISFHVRQHSSIKKQSPEEPIDTQ